MSDIIYPKFCVSADGYRENPERGTNLYRAEDGSPWIYNAWPETRFTFEITHPALKEDEQLELEQFYDQHIGDEVGWDNPRRQDRWIVRMVGPPRLASMRNGLRGDVEMTLVGYRGTAPINSTPPVVSGLHQIGQVISVSPGAWQSEHPMQFEYQWLRNGEPIAGATGQNYTLVDDDLFDMISVRVTASSLGGSTSVETDPVRARLDSAVSWLYSDIAETIFVDTSGNTPATWGDPVGLIKDSSGLGNDFTQPTVTARPILRESETGIAYLNFDGTDDLLSATLPAISGGTLVLATDKGIWIDDDFSFDGGSFDIGPRTYSGGLPGLLDAIGNPLTGGALVIDRQLTTAERARVVAYMQSIGSPGVIELGPELLVNGDFSDGFDGWTLAGSEPERWSVSDGVATIAVGTNPSSYIRQGNATEGGLPHLITVDIVSSNGVGNIRAGGGSDNQHFFQLAGHPVGEMSAAFVSGGVQPNFFQVNADAETRASISNISLREVIFP